MTNALSLPPSTSAIVATIERTATALGVPVALAVALAWRESTFDPNATGTVGEVGLFQLRPETAKIVGFQGTVKDLAHPSTNSYFALKHLKGLIEGYGGDVAKALSAYNAGKPIQSNQDYVADILTFARWYEQKRIRRTLLQIAAPIAIAAAVYFYGDRG